MKARFCSVTYAVAAAGLWSAQAACPAYAQEPQSAQAIGVEEIVVTATKRETLLQTTPLAITAITGDFLDALDARDFNAYVNRVPSLTAVDQGPGRKRYILRGVSNQDSNLSQATVAQYLDEVPITNSFGQQPDPRLIDVERVEVLRGPQGTIFGARSMAGAIRTVARKPALDRVEGNAQLMGSRTKFGGTNYSVEGVANAPLVQDELALRLAAFYSHEEGYVDNVFAGGVFTPRPGQLPPGIPLPPPATLGPINEENFSDVTFYGGRALLRWAPTDRLTVDAMVLGQHGEIDGVPLYDVRATGDESNGLITAVIGNSGNDDKFLIGTATAAYEFDAATFTAVASYFRRDNFNEGAAVLTGALADSGPGSTRAFGGDHRSYTAEARLASSGAGPWQWLAGVYAFSYYADNRMRDFVGFVNQVLGDTEIDDDSRERAAFGEISYDVLDRLTASVGVRYSSYRNRLRRFVNAGPSVIPLGPQPEQRFKESNLTWKFEVDGELNEILFLYAVAAEGFRPGGFNARPPTGVVLPDEFTSDGLWSYEAGAKTTWLDGRMTANGALYRIEWDNMQVLSFTQGLGPMLIPYTTNAGGSEIMGLEFELSARPTPSLGIDLSLNHFFKAELTAPMPPNAQGLAAQAGDPLPYNADWTVTLGGEYRRELARDLQSFIRVDWSYVGERTTGFRPRLVSGAPNNAFNSLDIYHTVDVRLGVSRRLWRATLSVENLFDERMVVNQQNFAPLPVTLRITRRPRTFGVSVRREF